MRMLQAIPALPVADIERSVEFYEAQLGFELVHREDSFVIFRSGEVELHLWEAGDTGWGDRDRSIGPVVSGAESFLAGTASCRVEVDGVDELHAIIKPLGVLHPIAPLRDEWYGAREFSIVDPDNNLLTFFEPRPRMANPKTSGGGH